jgi:DNA-binding MarR family transcriptional regulator
VSLAYFEVMTDRIRQELKLGAPLKGPAQEAYLTLRRTADFLLAEFEHLLAPYELTPTQYNVLRILRGAPGEIVLSEIASRMLPRERDMHGLLAGLERWKLATVAGEALAQDPIVAITEKGLAALAALDEPVNRLHVRQFQHLSGATVRLLGDLLDGVRDRPR